MNLIPTIDERQLKSLKIKYLCDRCGRTFSEKEEFNLHQKSGHP